MGNQLGSRIRFLREERNLSQIEMAKRLLISNVQLNRYESGARKPDPDMLLVIADFFRVSTDYLLGRTDRVQEDTTTYDGKADCSLLSGLKQHPAFTAIVRQGLKDERKRNLLIRIWQAIDDGK
ncbi:MAG: helix-turn-helix transcriptional regulator [Sporolactobacillus sp.]